MAFEQKVKVKINEPIAVLADPDRVALDRRYAELDARMKANAAKVNAKIKQSTIDDIITERKKTDRYDDVCRGFKLDKGFKPGDEVMLPVDIAQKWEEAGICSIIESKKAA